VLAGDFRQVEPIIIPHGGRAQIVNATMKRSHLWSRLEKVHLRLNMHITGAAADDERRLFNEWITSVGNGDALRVYGRAIQLTANECHPTN
jgi:hypothetical protein